MDTLTLVKTILMIIGGLGAFLVGMEMLQKSTEQLAQGGLKKMFGKTANNNFVGVGIGTLATMIMQSSGATTVMVVGFVNAGVMTLSQATAYIMGANIGTTITAQIVALGDLPLSQVVIALTLVGIFMSMFFAKKHGKVAEIGNLVAGLGILFVGLELMTYYMKQLFAGDNNPITQLLTSLNNPFLLFLIGIITTVMVQSSSAITSLVLAMAMAGVLIGSGGSGYWAGNSNGVLFLILGTNIGSTSTALISALGSSTNGKRAAVIHLLFNTFGSLIFFVVLLLWPQFNAVTFQTWFKDYPQFQISMFHTFFNVFCTILFFPFINVFVKLASWLVPDKKKKTVTDEEDDIIDDRFLANTAVATNQAITYYHLISRLALSDLNLAIDAFLDNDTSKKEEIDQKQADVLRMSRNLTSYIVKIVSAGVNEEANTRLSKMQLDIADLIRLTEVADNITGYTKHENNDHLTFSPVVYDQIKEMKKLLNAQFANADQITEKPSLVLFVSSQQLEDAIDNLRTEMIQQHMDRLTTGACKPENSDVFVNLVGNLERCGDHFNFICERAVDKSKSAHA